MNFVLEVFKFYQTDTYFKLVVSQVMTIFPTIFLVISLVGNFRLTHKKIENKPLRKAYHLRRLPYLMTYIICSVIVNLVIYPVIRVDVELPTGPVVDMLLVVLYLYALHCLMQLEAGLAVFMHLVICLPIMHVLDKYLEAGAASVGFFVDMGLFCFGYWAMHGNSLAKKYFYVGSIWDLENNAPEQ